MKTSGAQHPYKPREPLSSSAGGGLNCPDPPAAAPGKKDNYSFQFCVC